MSFSTDLGLYYAFPEANGTDLCGNDNESNIPLLVKAYRQDVYCIFSFLLILIFLDPFSR